MSATTTPARTIVGIDPGKTAGAMARLCPDAATVLDLPYIDVAPDALAILEFLCGADFVVVEKQQAMPKQGVSTTFQTGVGYGALLAVAYLSKVRVHLVSAASWKAKMGLSGHDKEYSRAMAIQLFPALSGDLKRKKDEGRAEALLLSEYGRRWL